MPTAIVGTTEATAVLSGLSGADAAQRSFGRGCASPDGVYAYYGQPASGFAAVDGCLYRVTVSDMSVIRLYPVGFFTSGERAVDVAISADGATLYVASSSGKIYVVAADGSTSSLPASVYDPGNLGSAGHLWFDPTIGKLFFADSGGTRSWLAHTTPGVWATEVRYWPGGGSAGYFRPGPWRADPTNYLIFGTAYGPFLLHRNADQGLWHEVLVANGGSGSTRTGSDPYSINPGQTLFYDSDTDGRVYYVDVSNNTRLRETNGVVTALVAGGARGISYLPSVNKLLVADTTGVKRVA